jgi:predicted N-acyltransferase
MDTALTLDLAPSIHDIPQAAWDTLAGGNPFVSHAFLAAVEDSGSTGARTGWLPRHAVLRDAEGAIAALAPMYVKGHSYGEYVFDHGWAHALERAGGQYYPKLQVASPFSPVPGPRLLLRQGTPIAAMGQALVSACQGLELSSVHVTFCTQAERDGLGDAGWLRRSGLQFHWHNRGYADFDAFLGALSSRKRKSIRRERRDAQNQGLEFVTMRGPEIDAATWAAFYGFYTSTVDRKWGSAYLTRRFFPLLGERLGDRVVLMLARRGREWVAGALNLLGEDTLYGRNWGASGEFPFLHFELCYYRAIDFAIGNGIATVEAGAQGEHKIQRGYLPTETHSAHWIAHQGLRRAVASFLAEEAAEKLAQMEALAELSPYRSDGEDEL